MPETQFPSKQQLLIPLLDTLRENGGAMRPKEAYTALAEKVGIPESVQRHTVEVPSAGDIRVWDRQVRWTRQLAALRGMVSARRRDLWELSEAGDHALRNIRPGAVVVIFEAPDGAVLWAEAEAAVGLIEDGSIQTIITSPPYPLLHKKDYANQKGETAHVEWLASFFGRARQTLAPDGSLVLNLGPAWQRGSPVQSLYSERLLLRLCDELGYHLAQRFYWHNPSKMPSPAEWVTVRRIRVTPAVEQVFWLGRSEHPKGNNRRVLRPYGKSMRNRLDAGGEQGRVRPSGHALTDGAFSRDNGGSIPHDLIQAPNSASNDAYQRACRQNGLPVHPARFPSTLPEFFVSLTTDPGDLVWDPFAGSLPTAAAARALGRRFLASEKSFTYARGGLLGRFGADAEPAAFR